MSPSAPPSPETPSRSAPGVNRHLLAVGEERLVVRLGRHQALELVSGDAEGLGDLAVVLAREPLDDAEHARGNAGAPARSGRRGHGEEVSGRPDDRNERRSVVREGEAPRRSDASRRAAPAASVDAAFDRARVPRVRARRRASRASGLGRTRNEKGFATVGHARRVERSRVRGGRRRTFCIFSSSCSALLSISLVRARTATTFSSSCHSLFACSLSRSAVAEGSSSACAVQSTVLSTTALVRSAT